jgi:hypothetical protein
VNRSGRLSILQLFHRLKHPQPNRLAIEVAIVEQGVGALGGFNGCLVPVVSDKQVGRAVGVEVNRHTLRAKRPGDAKPVVAAPVARTSLPRFADRTCPGKSFHKPPRRTRPSQFPLVPGCAVGEGARVEVEPAILDPLPDVAVHVVHAEGVGRAGVATLS